MRDLDFRSDTVTRPTDEMRRAMAEAEVGDDQYGEDPTVNMLEQMAADVVGMEAGLFVASGTMGNLCAVLSQADAGDEVILGDLSHLYQNELGGYVRFGGVCPRTISNSRAALDPADILNAVRPATGGFPRSALLCIENTHNWHSGGVITPEEMVATADAAHRSGLKVHLDGARIFNAAVALGVDVRKLTTPADTVQFCFSKGLAAPVGSILCGPRETVVRARLVRKALGGAMRQAGVLAAACIVALRTMRGRLEEDHANARVLAEGLAVIRGIRIDPSRVQTNIVAFELDEAISAEAFRDGCAERGLRIWRYGGDWSKVRMVTHLGLARADIDEALTVVSEVAVPSFRRLPSIPRA